MKTPRWIEQPRTLAALTLAFALVPAAVAYFTFKEARERDTKLFDTAAEVLGEQLKLSTFRPISFINGMRNQWRFLGHGEEPPFLPGGWQQRQPYLLAIAYASHDSVTSIPLQWQTGRSTLIPTGTNLTDDPTLTAALGKARLSATGSACSAEGKGHRLIIVQAVPNGNDYQTVRGYMIGWLDLNTLCTDQTLPILAKSILKATPNGTEGRRILISGEGEVKWTVSITRGSDFSREYGTPTPWIGFLALGLSVVPLGVLVMLASRAGKLRSALEAERKLGQMKNQFVSIVSHEFRTPLSVILSGAELLEAHAGQLSESRRLELLEQIKSSTGRMNEMVEQVLLLGRIESGIMQANPQPVDVAALCREIVEEVQIATQHRCKIEMKFGECTRSLDTALMRSVLVNLLTNAVKYSDSGGKVTFDLNERGFTVSDEGIGIPAADQSKLGEPFQRATNVGDINGTGLGLAVVQRCVALWGGTFTIHSIEGQGTQTIVTLPA